MRTGKSHVTFPIYYRIGTQSESAERLLACLEFIRQITFSFNLVVGAGDVFVALSSAKKLHISRSHEIMKGNIRYETLPTKDWVAIPHTITQTYHHYRKKRRTAKPARNFRGPNPTCTVICRLITFYINLYITVDESVSSRARAITNCNHSRIYFHDCCT